MNEGLLSVKNASGRQVSLLNTSDEQLDSIVKTPTSPASFSSSADEWQQDAQQSKRKYHCIEPGCNKSFTTSGHLARHNRIHTGEKNFPCLFPGCQSRFSRQDNMMQHYRTHMSPKSRRSHKRGLAEETRPKPRLHAHHRIRSDPVRVEPPLTIDQHLSNYHQSLSGATATHDRHTPVRFNFPLPLSSAARSPSNLKKVIPAQQPPSVSQLPMQHQRDRTPSPTLSHSSSASLPSIHHIIDDTSNPVSGPTSPPSETFGSEKKPSPSLTPSTSTTTTLFYQYRPLTFTRPQNSSFPYTLLHPAQQEEQPFNVARIQTSGNYKSSSDDHEKDQDKDSTSSKSPSSDGLLQLAHIVSTFG
ncbi:hypothetical protein [Parasitella parasitica]|uniref:C2H2-type domain-containing protein n=1 Tax=Parasitella parasitica TaxID=35722 RepID=A0A0B7N2V8_9FUNG|nr:hypothetical protein [Parasitella parasitica]